MEHLRKVVAQMKRGGYFDRIMSGGPELDRVKAFLSSCADERQPEPVDPLLRPHYPCFPGLRNRPWYEPGQFEAVRILEANFDVIREECLGLRDESRADYSTAAGPTRSWKKPWTMHLPDAPPGTWTLHLLYHMGVNVERETGQCPRTLAIVQALPGICVDYPWGDVLFSAMNADTHLRAHCSIENVRVRIHLGIVIPEGCSMRVRTETRSWAEGKCLVFEDAFEHEVWNRASTRRIVFIADLWHPDLTDIERRALTAGFRKSEVRRIFMGERIGWTDASKRYLPLLEAALERQDQEPAVREFWG
jgi:aspartate beta-hydroxylase